MFSPMRALDLTAVDVLFWICYIPHITCIYTVLEFWNFENVQKTKEKKQKQSRKNKKICHCEKRKLSVLRSPCCLIISWNRMFLLDFCGSDLQFWRFRSASEHHGTQYMFITSRGSCGSLMQRRDQSSQMKNFIWEYQQVLMQ